MNAPRMLQAFTSADLILSVSHPIPMDATNLPPRDGLRDDFSPHTEGCNT